MMIGLLVCIMVATPQEEALLKELEKMLGTPYRWGTTDCSGVISIAARRAGLVVRRTTTRRMYQEWPKVEARRGTAPIFSHGKGPAHVGVWILAGKAFIHSSSSRGVMVSDEQSNIEWWRPRILSSHQIPIEVPHRMGYK